MTADRAQDLELALALVDVADRITLSRFRAADLAVETKPDLTPVSEADRDVERALRDRLADDRPGDVVVGEEYGESGDAGNGRRWIVDPIDGTKSYVRGVPAWGTLLALEDAGEMVVGVVSAPALGLRWWAARGEGAYARDLAAPEPRKLSVSAVRELEDAHVCFGGIEEWQEKGRAEALLELSSRCWRTRGYGDFWQYMLVAEGGADVALDPVVSLWDVAAPMVIVQEAGGRFSDMGGAVDPANGDAMATNGALHDVVLGIVGR